jgi:molybdenum cofactor synthesis domain-containing protein
LKNDEEKVTTLVKAGIISASDRSARGEREDRSGLLLKSLLENFGVEVIAYQVLPDKKDTLKKALCHAADRFSCDLILTTGGTGLGPRDETPEATRQVIEKEIPGIVEAIRGAGQKKTPLAILSRAVAGIRGRTLIINLPGSPEGVQDAFETLKPILIHAVELVRGEVTDCEKVREANWKKPSQAFSHSLHSHS